MTKTKKNLKRSVTVVIVLFTLMLSVSLGLIGFRTFWNGMLNEYQKYVDSVLSLAVSDFDWDAIENSIKEQTEDEAFKNLRKRLDYIKNNTKISWLYMLEPLNDSEEDNMRYICTGNTPEDYQNNYDVPLGKLSGTEYPSDVARQYLTFYKNSEPGEFWYYPNKTEWGYVYTASIVVRTSKGTPLGVMSVDIYMDEIEKAMNIYPIVIALAALVLSVIFIVLLSFWLNRHVLYPIKKLETSARDFVIRANGEDVESLNFTDPQVKTGDEIESLSESLITMASETKDYMQKLLTETSEREKIAADLNAAASIQDGMLPHIFPGIPDRTDFELYASMNPAKQVGGDFYDFFFIDERHIALVIADVSGKGIPAALFMVISKTVIKNLAYTTKSLSPAKILEKANNQLCEGNSPNLFVTTWLGILDLDTGIITAANAGHEYPGVRQPGKKFELIKDKHGLVVAGMEGSKYTDYEIKLEKGATLFVYTDGVPEATNANNELFELERLEKALNIKPDASPRELLPIVRAEVDKFVGDAPQFDDLTMLSLRYFGRD